MAIAIRKALLVLLPFCAAGFAGGLLIGRANSIDYGNPATAVMYLAANGRWQHVDAEHGRLALIAEDRIYSYLTGSTEVTVSYASVVDIALHGPPRIGYTRDVGNLAAIALGGAPGAGFLVTLLKQTDEGAERFTSGNQRLLVVIASAVTLGSGMLGYHFGHNTKPDYQNEVFKKTLQEVHLWTQFEREWRTAYDTEVKNQAASRVARRAKPEDTESRPCTDNPIFGHLCPPASSTTAYVEKRDPALEQVFRVHPEILEQVSSDPLLR